MADRNEYSIEIENCGAYLHVIVGGLNVTPQVALDYWREIIDECDANGCSKILLEHNFAEMISMPEMLTIIGPVTDMLNARMLAFYDRYGHEEIPEAGKRILRSRDIKMQIFHDLSEAARGCWRTDPVSNPLISIATP